MGEVDFLGEESACGMPVAMQIDRLQREIDAALGGGFVVRNTDLYSLMGVERDLALDAVVTGVPSPFVLIEGQLVCTGAVEVPAVLSALSALAFDRVAADDVRR
ncbi:MAG: hypothetical protein HGB10_08720 [Coriobacteriia bacterium]|nr:hypothetical protein [Coriobacteriia bacterium]